MTRSPLLQPPDAGSGGSSSGVGAQAKGLADDAKRSAEAFAEERKTQSADRLHGVADTVSRVADDVAQESPAMGDFVRRAARGLDDVSRDLKDKSVADLLDMAKGFARREPAAFLAASAVAGFALSRLLKSSAQPSVASPAQGFGGQATSPGAGSIAAKPMDPSSMRPADAASDAKPAGAPSPVPSRLGTIGGEAPTSAGHGAASTGEVKPAGSPLAAPPVVTKLGEKGDAI